MMHWKDCPNCNAVFALQASLNDHLKECLSPPQRRIAELEAALLYRVQQDNGCRSNRGDWLIRMRPSDNPPCGSTGWDAEKCGCALEARQFLKDLQKPE